MLAAKSPLADVVGSRGTMKLLVIADFTIEVCGNPAQLPEPRTIPSATMTATVLSFFTSS